MSKATRTEINKNFSLQMFKKTNKNPVRHPLSHLPPVQLTLLIPSAHWQPLPPKQTESGM